MKAWFYVISTGLTLTLIVGGLLLTRGWPPALRMIVLTAAWLSSTALVTVLYLLFGPFFKRSKKVPNSKEASKH